MDKMIYRFSAQLREAIEIGKSISISKNEHAIHNVYVAGMGGSGIGGNFVAEFVRDECPVPYLVGKGYDVPQYINENTLALISSYSGNTEETFNSLREIEKKGARIVCIASGGEIIEHAKQKGHDYVLVPDNWSSPRACLGFSIVQQLYILFNLNLISNKFESEIVEACNFIDSRSGDIHVDAQKIAAIIHGKTTVIYSVDRMEPTAIRLRQQINENAKALCWHHVIPEMNHNELVGWRDNRPDLAVIVFRNHDDLKRNQARIEINKNIISKLSASWIEVYSQGSSRIEQTFYLVHLADWISWYLAKLRGVDAIEVDVLNHLKSELAKMSN